MTKEAIVADFRAAEPLMEGLANDNPDAESTIAELANLFDAYDVVADLATAIDSRTGPEIEAERLSPVLRALSNYGRRLLAELPGGTLGVQGLAG